MNFNKFLKSLFGDKSTRDMKLIQPLVETVKKVYPSIYALSHDELRAKTKEIQHYVQAAAQEEREKIAQLKATIEETPIDEREKIFNEIDGLEKEALEKYEKALNEVMPTAFSIIKDTARRFAENEEVVVTATDFDRELAGNPANDFITIDGDKAIYHNEWTAGGNKVKWDMVHYDVQLFGGIALHQGKIAEMATGEGKTLVATLPVFLNALTGNGVHMVTVNDYLAKRDSEWMGPLYMFNGLSVDCIDKHRPNSEARRKAYQADITFGMSLASTTCATIWPSHLPTSYSVNITLPLSMRSTPCSSTTPAHHSSSPVLSLKATTRCSRNTSPSSNDSMRYNASRPRSCWPKPARKLPLHRKKLIAR